MYQFKFIADTGKFMAGVAKMPTAVNEVTNSVQRLQGKMNAISVARPSNEFKKLASGASAVSPQFAQVGAQAQKTGNVIKSAMGGAIPVSLISSQMQQVKTAIAAAFAIGNLKQTSEEIIQVLAKYEGYEAVLTTVLGGNSAAGLRVMGDISQFAARTPFQVDELTESWQRFANSGIRPSMKLMANFGDMATSQNKSIKMWTEAVIDARMGEFERLKEFSVKAKVDKKSNNIKFTFKGISKEVKNDENAIVSYLASLGEMQGVKGMMDTISKTTGGQISNLKDQIDLLYLDIGRAAKPMITSVLGGLGEGMTHIKTNLNTYLSLAAYIGKIATAWLGYKSIVIGSSAITTTVDMIRNGMTGVQFATRVAWIQTTALRTASLAWAQDAFWGVIRQMKALGGMVVQLFTANFWQNTLRLGAISTFATMKAGAMSALQGLLRLPVAIAAGSMSMIRMGISSAASMVSYVVSVASATIAQWSLNAALLANPIGLVLVGFAAAGAAVYGIIRNWDTIKAYMSQFAAWAWQNNPFSWIGNLISSVFPNFAASVSGLMTTVKNAFMAGWNFIYKWFIQPVTSFFGSLMDFKVEIPTAKVEGDATSFMENGQKKSVYMEMSDLQDKKKGGKDDKKGGAKSHVSDGLAGVKSDSRITHITNNIKSLIEKVEIRVADASGISTSGIKEQLTTLLLEAVNDVNYAY